MPLPVPDTTDQEAFLHSIYLHVKKLGRWPTFEQVDDQLYRESHLRNAFEAWGSFRPGLVLPPVPVNEASAKKTELHLTVAAVRWVLTVDGRMGAADRFEQAFLGCLEKALLLEKNGNQPLTFKHGIDALGSSPEVHEVRLLGRVLELEPVGLGASTWSGGDPLRWSMRPGTAIRDYLGLVTGQFTDLDGYWNVRTARNPSLDERPRATIAAMEVGSMVLKGWSTDPEQVRRARVVALVLCGELQQPMNQTKLSVADALTAMGDHTQDAGTLAIDFGQGGLVRKEELTYKPGTDTLLLTAEGMRIRHEFREMNAPTSRRLGARKAILRWLDTQDGGHGTPTELLEAPESWWYGRQFTLDEIGAAATNLNNRKYIQVLGSAQALLRMQLTTSGTTCLEQHEGDPDQMDKQHTTGTTGAVSIQTYHQSGGNSAIGSTGFTQTSTTTIGQTTDDLINVLAAIRELDWVNDADDEIDQLSEQLQTADTEEAKTSAVRRAGRLIVSFYERAGNNPAAAAILTALGNYAAISAGLSNSS